MPKPQWQIICWCVMVSICLWCSLLPHSRYMINIHWLVRDAKQNHLHYISSCAADKCWQCHINVTLSKACKLLEAKPRKTYDDVPNVTSRASRTCPISEELKEKLGDSKWLKGSAEISGHFGSGGLWSRMTFESMVALWGVLKSFRSPFVFCS